MTAILSEPATLDPEICTRALNARDARFDGLFFVGITSTRIYCRPICPAKVSDPTHRRFFESAASAELAGFRPCLRCRPELAPGRAQVDAVSQLAQRAAQCIEAGALNGHGVGDLARELGVSERHLRRALERELGVSPVELARTHRLLLAKRLLADTTLSVTRVAFASGFQSLRRFNAVFRERYRLSPSAVRRLPRGSRESARSPELPAPAMDLVRLTLAYRPPLAWDALTAALMDEHLPGVESLDEGRFGRTVRIGDRTGLVLVTDGGGEGPSHIKNHLVVDVSTALLPVLMPLLSRLRHLFDLDAQPAMVDQHLAQSGLQNLVSRRPGLRIPGTLDGFEAGLRVLLAEGRARGGDPDAARRLVEFLGQPIATGVPGLSRLSPTAESVATLGSQRLESFGLPGQVAQPLLALARAMADGRLRLEPHRDRMSARRALLALPGMEEQSATRIAMRALYWPDGLPVSDARLQRAAGVANEAELESLAEQWRPWRGYATLHLGMAGNEA